MNKLKLTIIGIVVAAGLLAVPFAPIASASMADELHEGAGTTDQGAKATKDTRPTVTLQQQIQNVTNVLLFIIGAIAVIVIIFGGIKFITSDGDASKIKSARETILYAVVGVVIAIIAYAIVNWVIGAFVTAPTSAS